jgi:isopentenyldiphosphate isomerase
MKKKKEHLAIVDDKDRVIGRMEKDALVKSKKLRRAIRVYVKNPDDEYFLLRRANKMLYPGCWEIGCGGHVSYGETYLAATKRELREELGIRKPKIRFLGKVMIENSVEHIFCKIYLAVSNGAPKIQRSEITAWKLLPKKEALRFLKGKKVHTPAYRYFVKFARKGKL